jgi:hypothetical protein
MRLKLGSLLLTLRTTLVFCLLLLPETVMRMETLFLYLASPLPMHLTLLLLLLSPLPGDLLRSPTTVC